MQARWIVFLMLGRAHTTFGPQVTLRPPSIEERAINPRYPRLRLHPASPLRHIWRLMKYPAYRAAAASPAPGESEATNKARLVRWAAPTVQRARKAVPGGATTNLGCAPAIISYDAGDPMRTNPDCNRIFHDGC